MNKRLNESIEVHDTLNPTIWNRDKTLKTNIEKKILKIVDTYVEDSEVLEPEDVIDIHLVGSNASYNYSKDSDLDIHIVVNLSNLSSDVNMATIATGLERHNFNEKITATLKGVDIEISIEDVNQGVTSNGIYSVNKKKWLKEPQPIDMPDYSNDKEFNKLYKQYEKEANKLIKNGSSKEIIKFINDIYDLRKTSIIEDGEYGMGNYIFKELRNNGKLKGLKDRKVEMVSKELTLENYKKNKNKSLTEDLDETPSAPETPEENGISYNVIKLINDEWEAIQGYNDFLSMLREMGDKEDVIKVIEDIAGEENLHVGQLQAILNTVAPNSEKIGEGELEAEEQLSNPIPQETNYEDADFSDLYHMDDVYENESVVNDRYVGSLDFDILDNIDESLKESLYLFPELTTEDKKELKAYGLKYLGKNTGEDGTENNSVVVGTKYDLEKYAEKYLGYELHPNYFYYDEDDFAGDIIDESLNESNNKLTTEQKELYNFVTSVEPFSDDYERLNPQMVSMTIAARQLVKRAIKAYGNMYGNGFDIFSTDDFHAVSDKIVEDKTMNESLNESNDDKLVIYKELGKYRVTPESNYNSNISNARKVNKLDDFESADEIIDYYNKYMGTSREDFIIKEDLEESLSNFEENEYAKMTISKLLAKGDDYGHDYEGDFSWNLIVDGWDTKEFDSDRLKDYLYVDISSPVLDGYDSYTGLNIILPASYFYDLDEYELIELEHDLKMICVLNDSDIKEFINAIKNKDDDYDLNFFIDYDINFEYIGEDNIDESLKEDIEDSGYVNVSYKNNDVYQSILVKANTEEEAEEKFKAKKPNAEFLGARKINNNEFNTEHNKKGKPILKEALKESPDTFRVIGNEHEDYEDDIQEIDKSNETWRYNGEEIPDDYKPLIKNIIIEDDVITIRDFAFYNCTSLQTVTIPNSVTEIGDGAFKNCTSLQSITIPSNVKEIGYGAFYNCTSLQSITILNSVMTIEDYAFANCNSLKNVYYSGTKDEWYNIVIMYYNNPLLSANIHFNSNVSESLNESINDWIEVKSKRVQDSDGFFTDYTMYKNQDGSKYIFMFGDKDYEEPDESYADWEAETEQEANEWFDNYTGFEDEEDDFFDIEEEPINLKRINNRYSPDDPGFDEYDLEEDIDWTNESLKEDEDIEDYDKEFLDKYSPVIDISNKERYTYKKYNNREFVYDNDYALLIWIYKDKGEISQLGKENAPYRKIDSIGLSREDWEEGNDYWVEQYSEELDQISQDMADNFVRNELPKQ